MSRESLVAALAGAALLALPLQALPQAGGFIDRVDRADRWQRDPVARVIGPVIGQPPAPPVVVENRPSPVPAQTPTPAPQQRQGPAPKPTRNAKPDGDDGQRGGRHRGPGNRLVDKYDRFAGSDDNARELVTGLRNDGQIELSDGGKTTKFTPATSKMGWGNVDHALGLAEASLAEHGIHKPTPDQIKAALNGGTITTNSGQTVKLDGVLKLRSSGMGWGEIAHKLGFKRGEVKQADKKDHKHGHKRHDGDKHHHKHADWKHHRHDRHDGKHDRADSKRHERPYFHRTKFDRPHRPDKVERPEKYERPRRPERPERHHHRR